jgi:hypothetical protein
MKQWLAEQVVEGQNVVIAIGNVPRDGNDKPITPVVIQKVTIERVAAEPASPEKQR